MTSKTVTSAEIGQRHLRPLVNSPQSVAPAEAISHGTILRLIVDLIAAEQSRLIRAKAMSARLDIYRRTASLENSTIKCMAIDEETLGFDSLALLELILRFNKFFQLHTSGAEDYLFVQRTVGAWAEILAAHLAQSGKSTALGFETSGSAGPPKTIVHSFAHCAAEVSGLSKEPLANWQPSGRVLALVAPRHIYGFLWTCLLPDMTQRPVIDLHQRSPSSVFNMARAGDLVIATPFIWNNLLQTDRCFAPGVQGITSAGPAQAATFEVCDRAGLQRLTEIYGATETGGVGFRSCFTSDFSLLPHLDRSEDDVLHQDSANGVLKLQDNLCWTGPREFQVTGRLDDVVQIAGVNVSPQLVTSVLQASDLVDEAAVRFEDGRLKAFVVPKEVHADPLAFEDAFLAYVKANLDPVARPMSLRFGSNLPRNAMGKLTNWD